MSRFLPTSPRLKYIFDCGLDDLKHGLNHRVHRPSEQGLVMRAQFADVDVFYVAGSLKTDDIDWMFSFGGKAEIHCPPDQRAPIEARDSKARIESFHLVRYYLLESPPPILPSSRCRPIVASDFETVGAFVKEFGDEPVYYDDMNVWPAFGIWEGTRLVAFARTVFLNGSLGACQLGHFLTHPDYRGKGHAKDLGHALLHSLVARGIHTFRLDVYDQNASACRVYEQLGFRVEDIAPMASLLSPLG